MLPDESPGFISAVFDIGRYASRCCVASGFHQCLCRNDVNDLERLLDGGLSVNDCDSQGRSLLHFAAACGNEDIVRVLLERSNLCLCLSVCLSVCLPVGRSIRLSVRPSVYLPARLPVCPSIWL